MAKNIFWTQNQRDIKVGLDQGKTVEQLMDEGYGKESITKVQSALDRGLLPPEKKKDDNHDGAPEEKETKSKTVQSKGDGAKTEKNTTVLEDAQQIKWIPKVYTADYTPIMRAGRAASIREWGWREDMPLENFLDTVIYHFFKDRGITLAGYFVEKEEDVNAS